MNHHYESQQVAPVCSSSSNIKSQKEIYKNAKTRYIKDNIFSNEEIPILEFTFEKKKNEEDIQYT